VSYTSVIISAFVPEKQHLGIFIFNQNKEGVGSYRLLVGS